MEIKSGFQFKIPKNSKINKRYFYFTTSYFGFDIVQYKKSNVKLAFNLYFINYKKCYEYPIIKCLIFDNLITVNSTLFNFDYWIYKYKILNMNKYKPQYEI